jgi:hypothetical protein
MKAIRGRQPLSLGQGVAEPDRVQPRNALAGQPVALRGARSLTGDPCIPRLGDREHRELVRRELDRPAALRSPVRQRHPPRRDGNHLVSCTRVHGQVIVPTPVPAQGAAPAPLLVLPRERPSSYSLTRIAVARPSDRRWQRAHLGGCGRWNRPLPAHHPHRRRRRGRQPACSGTRDGTASHRRPGPAHPSPAIATARRRARRATRGSCVTSTSCSPSIG